MRARAFLLCTSVALVSMAVGIEACGDTADSPAAAGTPDAATGSDSPTTTTPNDTGLATAQETSTTTPDTGCDPTHDFSTDIPDASIGDSGSTTGLCLQCAHASCATQLAACNQDCDCQGLAGEGLACYLKNQANPIACASVFAGVDQNTQTVGIGLIGCINSKCKDECATAQFADAGPDANK